MRFVDAGWSSQFGWGVGCDGAILQVTESPDGGYYIAGRFANCGDIRANNIAHFDPATGIWSPLGSDGGNGVSGTVINAIVFRGELLIHGAFSKANVGAAEEVTTSPFATWDGSQWSSVDDPILAQLGDVEALQVWNDLLYIGGYFEYRDATNTEITGIAVWDGTHLSGMGAGTSGNLFGVVAIAIHDDELYVGVPISGGVRRWDGAHWVSIGSDGGNGLNGAAQDLISWNGSLYATGGFTIANHRAATSEVPASRVARWDGSQWSALGSGLDNTGQVLVVADDQLVVSGLFASAGGIAAKQLARWDGQQWATLASDLVVPSFPQAVYSMLDTPVGLLVAGAFPYAVADPALAEPLKVLHGIGLVNDGRWSGWEGAAGDGFYGDVRTFARFQDDLYVGGAFRSIGGEPFNGIARWDGAQWQRVGTGNGNGVNGSVFD